MKKLLLFSTIASFMLPACGGTDPDDLLTSSQTGDDAGTEASSQDAAPPDSATDDGFTTDAPVDGGPAQEASVDAADADTEAGIDASPSDGCQDLCTVNDVQCAAGGVQTCEPDPSGCLAWSAVVSCPLGQVCSGGICASTCQDQCSAGAKKCTGNATQQCEMQASGCLDWSVVTACAVGTTCLAGTCSCDDGCVEGASQCSGDAVQTCEQQPSGCTDWGPAVGCSQSMKCSGGQCALTCQDACTPGSAQCSQGGTAACELQSNGCYDWSPPVSCPAGTTCSSGVCSCTDVCTQGAKQCVGNETQSCEQQASGCADWSASVACPAEYLCVAGECEPTCGDGVLSANELCDIAIPSGPGACPTCPRTELCVDRTLLGKGTCQAACVDSPITTAGDQDMCCVAPGDPDCLSDYPLSPDFDASSVNYGQLGCSPSWNAKSTHMTHYMSLAPTTCSVPVRLTMLGVSPGLGSGTSRFELSASTAGAYYFPDEVGAYPPPNEGVQNAFMIGMSDTVPSFLDIDYRVDVCSQTSFHTDLYLDARPIAGVSTGTSGVSSSKIVGDMVGQHVVSNASGALTVTPGRFIPGQFDQGGWSADFVPATWTTTATAQIAASGVTDFSAAVQPITPIATYVGATAPIAHVVWSSSGTQLSYARVLGNGSASSTTVLHTGSGISEPNVVMWSETSLGILWRESMAGKNVLRLARATLSGATATLGSIVEVTLGEGDVADPALAVSYRSFSTETWNVGMTWVDTRSGLPKLYFQQVDGETTALMGAPQVVSDEALSPSAPTIQSLDNNAFRILWTDRRNGHRSVFVKDNLEEGLNSTVVPFAGEPEDQVSPTSVDAYDGTLALIAPNINYSNTQNKRNFTVPRASSPIRITWIDAAGQVIQLAQVRLGSPTYRYEVISGAPIPLSCASSSSPMVLEPLSEYYSYHGPEVAVNAAHNLVSWVEGGVVMTQGVSGSTLGRVPL